MKTSWRLQIVCFTVLSLLMLFSLPKAEAALADGTYTLNYTVTKAENDSASMANDYFEKPATVYVKNGQAEMQLVINHSKWVTQFKVQNNTSFTDAKIISSDSVEDKRVARFQVADLSKPIISKIHVTVESIDYDHDYTIRFLVDEKSIRSTTEQPSFANVDTSNNKSPAVTAPSTSSNDASKSVTTTPKSPAVQASAKEVSNKSAETGDPTASRSKIANPQTGDTAPVILLTVLLLLSALYLGYTVKTRKSGR
ncbi:heme uptake protein IsdC [Paenibacillus sp. 1_12]|uniref:heme uptake protein IsdC n=1 Tax=Paenibacillus sp. 1_12 TaxID=1566278 RepID=UPI0008E06C0B|nr:heme uptake protein IsdC [Paenibacillus sp. 1_12]SFL44208.1 heme uptake protein IsdC [Paenibacillus sp. 1_12]